MSILDILDFNKKKPMGLHFGDDFVIREIKDLKLVQGYLFDKKKDRAWPLIHNLLMATNGGFPYSQLMTDNGIVDPFDTLTPEEKNSAGDGKFIAKSSIRDVMHNIQKEHSSHTVAIMLGFCAAVVFVLVLVMVLLFVKGKLSVG